MMPFILMNEILKFGLSEVFHLLVQYYLHVRLLQVKFVSFLLLQNYAWGSG